MNEAVKEVRIPAAVGNFYTNKLYRKIAEQIGVTETRYGSFQVYSTSFESFARFCQRFT
ncbi:hypothetical protein [Paenibacillus sp. N3.4]|uniref:hypothetical protein n=1 Tax=Paenibacillus sp. N3.4 TaxID=2603222 RepID=UPI00164FC650|nr:hypothetical protein [Paenibacillus sp. N3.4]